MSRLPMASVALAAPWLRWTLLPLSTAATLVFVVRRVWLRAAARKLAAEEARLQEVVQRMEERLPSVARTKAAASAVASAAAAASSYARGAERLAASFRTAGSELAHVFKEFTALKDLDEEVKPVGTQCAAWHEFGEAEAVFAARVLDIVETLRRAATRAEADAERYKVEGERVQRSLAEAEVSFQLSRQQPRGWLARLLAGRQPTVDEAEQRQLLDGHWTATGAALEKLAAQLDAARQRNCSAFNEAAAEVRALAKELGEKMVVLRPSIKRSSAAGGGVSQRLEGLITKMSTAEGRQKLRDAEAAEETLAPPSPCSKVEQMVAPPAEATDAGGWRIRGVYEYQVLKAGLRHLDNTWPVDQLLVFPRGKDGNSLLFRERLLSQLLEGSLRLQSITNNDVAAAQRDVDRLSLRQLLRLRVLHLDFTPSGCGADTVTAVGGTHEAFLSKLDGLLFRQLGQRALGALAKEPEGGALLERDAHRLGRQAVLTAAAALAVPSPPWWCWWVTSDRRAFFHAERFESEGTFPAEGVLEVTDLSKADRHEPTGKLRWFDWKADVVTSEANLSPRPPGDASPSNEAAGEMGEEHAAEDGSQSPTRRRSTATGAAAAAMVSPEVLHGMRSSLRKTGGPGRQNGSV